MSFIAPFPGGGTVTHTFRFNATSPTTSFASVPIGTASAGRVVVVTTNNSLASSLTIGGISATSQVSQGSLKIWSAVVPTGTTATITCNASVNIVVYTLDGAASATASATAHAASNSTTISENGGSAIIAIASTNANTATQTWTNVTKDAAHPVVGFTDTSASADLSTTNASLSVSVAFGAGASFNIAVACWNP